MAFRKWKKNGAAGASAAEQAVRQYVEVRIPGSSAEQHRYIIDAMRARAPGWEAGMVPPDRIQFRLPEGEKSELEVEQVSVAAVTVLDGYGFPNPARHVSVKV